MTRNRTLLLASVLVLATAGAQLLISRGHLFDLGVYRQGAVEVARRTGRLYDFGIQGYPFTYPPAAALALTPLVLLPLAAVKVVWTVLLAPTLAVAWWVSFRAGERGHVRAWAPTGSTLVLAVAASAVLLDPIERNFHFGQVNLVLLVAVLLDLLGWVGEGRRGLLTGLASAFKLTPLVFLLFLVLTRQWRAASNALLAFAGAAAVGFLLLPVESWRYWTQLVVHTARIGPVARASNQSVMGLLVRLGAHEGSPVTMLLWVGTAGGLGVAGTLLAVHCWRRGEELLAVSLVGLVGLLASPISWTHHWVWCIPLGVGLASATRRWTGNARSGWFAAGAWWAVFVVAPQKHVLPGSPVETLLGSSYLLASVVLMAYVGWWLVDDTRTQRRPATADAAPVHAAR